MSNTFYQSPEIVKKANTEFKTKQTLNGNPVYWQYLNLSSLRISNSGSNIIQNVNDIYGFNLKFQATTGGEINFLPYVHTDNSKVYLNMSGNNLRIITNGGFVGNYKIWGWVKYTKSS